jgi:hypothetical protein
MAVKKVGSKLLSLTAKLAWAAAFDASVGAAYAPTLVAPGIPITVVLKRLPQFSEQFRVAQHADAMSGAESRHRRVVQMPVERT